MEKLNSIDFVESANNVFKGLMMKLDRYIELSSKIQNFSFAVRFDGSDWRDDLAKLKNEQMRVAEAMKFDNPLIWLIYKRRAYIEDKYKAVNKGESIITFKNLVEHCEVDGTCSKRFDFLNKFWAQKYGKSLTEYIEDKNIDLEDLAKRKEFLDVTLELIRNGQWSDFENFTKDGGINKWGNYQK